MFRGVKILMYIVQSCCFIRDLIDIISEMLSDMSYIIIRDHEGKAVGKENVPGMENSRSEIFRTPVEHLRCPVLVQQLRRDLRPSDKIFVVLLDKREKLGYISNSGRGSIGQRL